MPCTARIAIFLLMIVLRSAQSHAEGIRLAKNLKFKGDFETGLGYVDNSFGQRGIDFQVSTSEYVLALRAELIFALELSERLSTVVSLEGDGKEPGVRIRKGWVDYRLVGQTRLLAGNLKRDFGFEDASSRHNLRTVNRSLLYEYFDSFNAVGYDASARYRTRWLRQAGPNHVVFFNVSGNGSQQVFFNGSWTIDWTRTRVLASELFGIDVNSENFGIFGAGFETARQPWYVESELYSGKDPNLTAVLKRMGERKSAKFVAVRALGAFLVSLPFTAVTGIEPVLSGVYIMPNVADAGLTQAQGAAGFNILFDQARAVIWKNDADVVYANDPSERTLHARRFSAQTRICVSW
jgi:hypothetical protein